MKKIKVSEVLLVSRILNPAKYTELANSDKAKLLRIILTMKDAADKFEADTKVVVDKLKESDYKDYDEHLAKAQEYENLLRTNGDMSKSPIGAAEYDKFIKEEFQEEVISEEVFLKQLPFRYQQGIHHQINSACIQVQGNGHSGGV